MFHGELEHADMKQKKKNTLIQNKHISIKILTRNPVEKDVYVGMIGIGTVTIRRSPLPPWSRKNLQLRGKFDISSELS